MSPQNEAILELLRRRGAAGITPIEALSLVGTLRLGARVWELKAVGYAISSEKVRTPSGKHVSRYVLHESDQLRMAM